MFEEMISAIQDETVRRIFSARIKSEAEVKRERVAEGHRRHHRGRRQREKAAAQGAEDRPQRPLPLRQRKKV